MMTILIFCILLSYVADVEVISLRRTRGHGGSGPSSKSLDFGEGYTCFGYPMPSYELRCMMVVRHCIVHSYTLSSVLYDAVLASLLEESPVGSVYKYNEQ